MLALHKRLKRPIIDFRSLKDTVFGQKQTVLLWNCFFFDVAFILGTYNYIRTYKIDWMCNPINKLYRAMPN